MVLPSDLPPGLTLTAPEEVGAKALATDAMTAEVFVVDDEPSELSLVEQYLEQAGYWVRTFCDPRAALEGVAERSPSVVITDLQMPGMSGLELGLAVKEIEPDVRIILLTGTGGESAAQQALRLGASDYLSKPPNPDELLASVRRAVLGRAADLHHRRLVGWMKEELIAREETIRQLTLQTLSAMVNTQDERSPHFKGHSKAVAMQAAAIAQTLGMSDDEIEVIRTAGLLHDIGMIAVPDDIVQKPGALTADEYATVREHCSKGVEILAPMKHLGPALRFIEEHHERWDGAGYPAGKQGHEISTGGQVLGIAEAWTSFISNRPYRAGKSRADAEEIFRARAGDWFSRGVTDALMASDVGLM